MSTPTFFIIPTYSDPFYRIRTDLDGVHFVLDFSFNVRENCWYLAIQDSNEVDLCQAKLVCYSVLTAKSAWNPSMPLGQLMVITNTNDDSPPGQYDLVENTGRCQLVYISPTVST